MNKKIGFIGLGKMATSIISGILAANTTGNIEVAGYDLYSEVANKLSEKYPVKIFDNVQKLTNYCDIVFFSVKPFVIKDVLNSIKEFANADKTFISIAAGISIDTIEEYLGNEIPIVRVMPNTPALVKTGMCVFAANKNVSDCMKKYVETLLLSIGKVIKLDEKYFDAVTALSDSGPAFYYYLINEFAKSAVKEGLSYNDALLLSAQTAMGAAKMILETGDTPEILIKNVTTPGGTTEVGNNVLNNSDIPTVFDAVIAKTAQKSKDLGK